MERRLAGATLVINVGVVGQQQGRHGPEAQTGGQVQWCRARLPFGIDIGMVGEQKFDHRLVTAIHGQMQRREIVGRLSLTAAPLSKSNCATLVWPA
jgi:hypothetical protein